MRLVEDAAGVVGREVLPFWIPVPTPAAGAEITITVPGGVVWFVRSLRFQLATSAVVANRLSRLAVTDADGNAYFHTSSAAVLTASNTNRYCFSPYMATSLNLGGTFQAANMIHGPLAPGHQIITSTQNIDVGDQYSLVFLFVLSVWERPYDVELERDLSRIRGDLSNALPEIHLTL